MNKAGDGIQMAGKLRRKGKLGQQVAALPLKEEDGETLVLLVTSRETGRWVLPKGWAEKRLSGGKLAAKEAYEEAGIEGEVIGGRVGSYTYLKRLRREKTIECRVDVFPMRVSRLLDKWPEAKQRRREWFTLAQAALQVEEGELVTMLLHLAAPPREFAPVKVARKDAWPSEQA
jgi:8-oxo-dGTP pyrophosphatase MutT (NUDIX family)